MIFTLIITGLIGLVTMLFTLISIPAMPVVLTAGLANALDFMILPLQIVKAYVGHVFFIAIITAIVVLANIKNIWAVIMFLYHKIRG